MSEKAMTGKDAAKRIAPVALALILVVIIAIVVTSAKGCSNKTPKIDKSDDVYLTLGDMKVTNDRLYTYMKQSYGVDELLRLVDSKIYEEKVNEVNVKSTSLAELSGLDKYIMESVFKKVLTSTDEEGIKKATLIAKATAKGCKYYGLKYGEVEVYLDGSKVTEQTLAATSIIGKDPVKGTDKYTLALVNGATTVKYQITAQLSAYDENNNKIGNLSGITFNLASVELDVTGKSGNIDLFDLVTSVEIKNELTASGRPEYKTEGGKLIVYTNSTDNYKTGWVSVTASQYRADGVLIAAGTLKLQEIK